MLFRCCQVPVPVVRKSFSRAASRLRAPPLEVLRITPNLEVGCRKCCYLEHCLHPTSRLAVICNTSCAAPLSSGFPRSRAPGERPTGRRARGNIPPPRRDPKGPAGAGPLSPSRPGAAFPGPGRHREESAATLSARSRWAGLREVRLMVFVTILDMCMSSLRRGHANILCIVPILTDDPRRESREVWLMVSSLDLPPRYRQPNLPAESRAQPSVSKEEGAV